MDRKRFIGITAAGFAGISAGFSHQTEAQGQDFRGATDEDSGRRFVEGVIPLVSVEGTARDCGNQLGHIWRDPVRRISTVKPSYGPFIPWWREKGETRRLIDHVAPHLNDIMIGIMEGAGVKENLNRSGSMNRGRSGCTSFSVHQDLTREGRVLSGQNKDTGINRMLVYRVLRLKPTDGAGFLTVTYPGEIAGYGMSGTGMSAFRNGLYVTPPSEKGLPFDLFILLGLLCENVDDVIEIAQKHGVLSCGNVTFSDKNGRSAAIEFGAEKICAVHPSDGVLAHANHPDARGMKPFEDYPPEERKGSYRRQLRLREGLIAEAGRLTAPGLFHILSDHYGYPLSTENYNYDDI